MSSRTVIASVGGLALLSACVAIVGECDLAREPQSWSLRCGQGGSAIVVPPSTLSTIVPAASGAKP
jgi:hypothetical protein